MSDVNRIAEYYPFDEEVLEAVEKAQGMQESAGSYSEFLDSIGYEDNFIIPAGTYPAQEAVDIRRKDEKSSLLIHLAMGQPLDPNNLYQISTIAAANPYTRILASANPNGFDPRYGKLNKAQRTAVADGDFTAVNEPMVRNIEKKGITEINQYGYSYGADKALGATQFEAFDVPKTVVIEPVTVVKRSLVKLAADFGSSDKALKGYVEKSGQQFIEARDDSLGLIGFAGSLATKSNIAIARGLAKGGFEDRARAALDVQEDMELSVIWGDASELVNDGEAVEQTDRLAEEFGSDRVRTIRLNDHKHAMANDVLLQAALVTQSLKTAS